MDALFIWFLVLGIISVLFWFARTRFKAIPEYPITKPTHENFPIQQSARNPYGETRQFDPLPAALDEWKRDRDYYDKNRLAVITLRSILKGSASLFGFAALLILVLSLFVVVGTNKVGIMVEAGKPVGAESNGFHFKKPWAQKTEFDGTQQFLRFDGDGNNEEDLDKKVFPRIEVKLDGQAKAWISGTIAWQMKAGTDAEKKNAVELFKTYRTFDRLTVNLAYASTRKAIGEVFAHHNPLVPEKNQDLGTLNSMALIQLQKEFEGQLFIVSVDLKVPDYDDQTDQAISALQAQKAKTGLAQEELLTNQAKSAANKALEASVQNPAVNVANCIQAAIQLGKEPGYCLMGGATPIVGTGGAKQ